MAHEIAFALGKMTEDIREVNVAKGFRVPEGGPGSNTFGDYIALLHSEVSEALEAYRSWKLEDATQVVTSYGEEDHMGNAHPIRTEGKPEGVGSELADVLIRLVDMADVFGIDLAQEYHRKLAYNRTRTFQHGGRVLNSEGT